MTRAQALGIWSLASELATDAEIEIQDVDNYGSLIVKASSTHLLVEVRYKLHRSGQREKLEGEEPVSLIGSTPLNGPDDV